MDSTILCTTQAVSLVLMHYACNLYAKPSNAADVYAEAVVHGIFIKSRLLYMSQSQGVFGLTPATQLHW